jgi:regulator of replication initiation timing
MGVKKKFHSVDDEIKYPRMLAYTAKEYDELQAEVERLRNENADLKFKCERYKMRIGELELYIENPNLDKIEEQEGAHEQ